MCATVCAVLTLMITGSYAAYVADMGQGHGHPALYAFAICMAIINMSAGCVLPCCVYMPTYLVSEDKEDKEDKEFRKTVLKAICIWLASGIWALVLYSESKYQGLYAELISIQAITTIVFLSTCVGMCMCMCCYILINTSATVAPATVAHVAVAVVPNFKRDPLNIVDTTPIALAVAAEPHVMHATLKIEEPV